MISGLKHLVEQGRIKSDELTVAYITGNGLKTLEAVDHVVRPVHTLPNLEAFEEAMAATARS